MKGTDGGAHCQRHESAWAPTRCGPQFPNRRGIGGAEIEVAVETWVVGGRKVTNRAGAAEYLGLARRTVVVYSTPGGRRRYGWPEPLAERVDGQEVFALGDLDAFAARRAGGRPQPPAVIDPEELIGVAEFAALRGIKAATMKRYVEDSLNAWQRGEAGYLPRPDEVHSARRGSSYRWRYRTAVEWSFPAVRRTGGRRPGRRPLPEDLRQLLDSWGSVPRPTVRALAAGLSSSVGTEVSSQTVRRLLRRLRDAEQSVSGESPRERAPDVDE